MMMMNKKQKKKKTYFINLNYGADDDSFIIPCMYFYDLLILWKLKIFIFASECYGK